VTCDAMTTSNMIDNDERHRRSPMPLTLVTCR
jgi:hypothetical protein